LIGNDKKVLGSSDLNLDRYTSVKEGDEIFETQTLFFKEKEEQINAAELKWSFLNGR
jgi:hypothetical protein